MDLNCWGDDDPLLMQAAAGTSGSSLNPEYAAIGQQEVSFLLYYIFF